GGAFQFIQRQGEFCGGLFQFIESLKEFCGRAFQFIEAQVEFRETFLDFGELLGRSLSFRSRSDAGVLVPLHILLASQGSDSNRPGSLATPAERSKRPPERSEGSGGRELPM